MKRIGTVRCDESRSVADNARRALPRLARAYFKAGRQVLDSKRSARTLHRLRLETKRLRYTLEVFLPAYGPSLESRIESLRRIQDLLGVLNDCVSTRRLLLDGRAKPTPRLRRLIERLDRQSARLAGDFVRHWETTFDAPGQQQRWVAYLTQFAGGRRQTG